jgi:ATP-dependent Lhr-like helicase
VRKQLKRSQLILDALNIKDDFPIVNESYNEIMNNTMDVNNAEQILSMISSGEISVAYSEYSNIPSPFAHNVVLIGVSDIILMEDRSTLLRELHQQVLSKVFSDLEYSKPRFELETVKKHFKNKFPVINDKAGIYSILSSMGPLLLFKERGKSVYSYTTSDQANVRGWAYELAKEKKIISIFRNNDVYWIPRKHLKYYYKLYSNTDNLSEIEKSVYSWLHQAGSVGRKISVVKVKGSGDKTKHEPFSQMIASSELPELEQSPTGIQKKMLMKILRNLEKRMLIHRIEDEHGYVTWFIDDSILHPTSSSEQMVTDLLKNEYDQIDFESAIEFIVTQYLNFFAPATVSEIAYNLNLSEPVILKTLNELEDALKIKSGNLVIGKEIPQYVSSIDFTELEQQKTQHLPVVTGSFAEDFIFTSNFNLVDDIEAYFDKFGIAFGLREMFIRTKEFDLTTWNKNLQSKTIVAGRFLNGRVCYIKMTDVPVYVSAYRKASLNNQELSVLNIIKSHRGITRRELSKKFDARQMDLKDIIDKLEHNLYIIREPKNGVVASSADTDQVGDKNKLDDSPTESQTSASTSTLMSRTANKYMYYELGERVENAEVEIIKRLVHGSGPLSVWDIRNYTGFSDTVIEKAMNFLIKSQNIKKFIVSDGKDTEMYISSEKFQSILDAGPVTQTIGKVKILSMFDIFSTRLSTEFRMRFGEGWYSPVIYNGHLIGFLDLWRLASCIEIREIIMDDELIVQAMGRGKKSLNSERIRQFRLGLLKDLLEELNKLMKFYKLYGLDIIRLRGVFGYDVNSLPAELADVLNAAGYSKIQNFFVKGRIDSRVFKPKQIMRFVLQNQHILPKNRFTNPLKAIRSMGGIRSTNEMRLRLDGNFYEIKEFRKNLNLVAGPMIPDYYMYCTEKDIQLYKAAKGRSTDFNMEYILENIPDKASISTKNLFDRLTLTKEQFKTARKQLYDGLFIVRDPLNRYRKVRSRPLLTKQYARKVVLKRIIRNFGIVSVEGLAAFTKGEYSVRELRTILRELEDGDELVKGYFQEEDDTLYWVNENMIARLQNDKSRLIKQFIITPQDQLAAYLAPVMRKRFGSGSSFIIFNGFEISGAFKIKQKSNKVWVTEFQGDDNDWSTMEDFFRQNKLELIDEDAEELYSNDEDLF